VLPGGFHRIRHYGLFTNGSRADSIARARELLSVRTSQTQSADANAANADEPPAERGSTPRYRPPPPTAIRIDTS
jgi:hypothetical protein